MVPNRVEVPTTWHTDKDVNKSLIFGPNPLQPIVWRNVIAFGFLHIAALYGLYQFVTEAKILTILWSMFWFYATILGIVAGAHRLWSHRAYKARWPLRLVLTIWQTAAFQNSIFEWSRDHRLHHKYTDTNADPYNPKRGIFFAHMGWLLVRKHPDVKTKGANLDLSDLMQDPFVVWQKKLYPVLMPLCTFLLPTLVPCYFWNEHFVVSYSVTLLRFATVLHLTWLVNSIAHRWGMKPYDKDCSSTENKMASLLSAGEGWHNYHHAFPWDYRTSELNDFASNGAGAFIDFCAYLGLAYDLKTTSAEMIKKRAVRTGDGSKYK